MGRQYKPGEHTNRGGLAGTVGTEQAEKFTATNAKAQAFDDILAGIGFGQIVDSNHGLLHDVQLKLIRLVFQEYVETGCGYSVGS